MTKVRNNARRYYYCFNYSKKLLANYSKHLLMQNQPKAQQKRWESSSNNTRQTALQYLETWVGNNSHLKQYSNNPTAPITPNSNVDNSDIKVTGSSYILPTIRLDKSISSSKELNTKLESFFDESNKYIPHAIKSMLKPRRIKGATTKYKINNGDGDDSMTCKHRTLTRTWRVPIILDLQAFQHDGSPHYKPPPNSFVKDIFDTLDTWGISVIGVCNINIQQQQHQLQDDENGIVSLSTSLNQQVIDLGLPILMSRVGRTLGGTLNKNGYTSNGSSSPVDGKTSKESYGIGELIQIITKHIMTEDIKDKLNKDDDDDDDDDEKEIKMKNFNNIEHIQQMRPPVVHVGMDDDSSLSSSILQKENIEEMSFLELQQECKIQNLGAMGSPEILRKRLIDHFRQDKNDDRGEKSSNTDCNNDISSYVTNTAFKEEDGMHVDEKHAGNDDDTISAIIPAPIIPAVKVYKGNVRSGQQVTTDEPNQSLIIIGNVSSGGEIMSDNDIYVYGALRGRAIAGLGSSSKNNNHPNNDVESSSSSSQSSQMTQQQHSKIFASRFDAELVCIGSHFTTIDSIADLGLKPTDGAMVSVNEEKSDLQFTKF